MIDPTASSLDQWDSQTQAFLASQSWNPSDSLWLLAVSGGADSVALLHWARRAAPGFRASLAVAHVNHGLRRTAGRDQAFVADLCRGFGIPFFSRDLDPRERLPRESIEMWARRERYGFFETAAREAVAAGSASGSVSNEAAGSAPEKTGPYWILTAHHRDDLVETVFQRLGRGTGPRGLRGIPFLRGRIARPFLNRPRSEILAGLNHLGARWMEDETNADTAIDRNWYRHRYLPALRRAEPDLDARVLAMAMQVHRIGKGIDALEAEEALLQSDAEGRPYLNRDGVAGKVADYDLEALDFWMRKLVRASAGTDSDLAVAAIAATATVVSGSRPIQVTKEILREFRRQWNIGPDRLQVPLNGRLALKCRNQGIYCVETASIAPKRRSRAKKTCSTETQRVILIEGSAHAYWRWGERNYSLAARRYPRPVRLEFPSPAEGRAIFDADLFSCTLLIRTRKDGDRFSPLGMPSRSRKLKTFFNEEKVPTGMRDIIPIIISGESPADETPAWVPGYGISDFFKVSGSTSHILELVLTCENP